VRQDNKEVFAVSRKRKSILFGGVGSGGGGGGGGVDDGIG